MSRNLKIVLALLLVAAMVVATLWLPLPEWLRRLLEGVRSLGPWGSPLFVLVYAAACVLMVPASVLTLGAGAVFGLVKGVILVSLASTLGAIGAFLIGRYLARDWVARRLAAHLRFQAIDRGVAEQGWKIVLLTRLSPVFPFTLLNYAFGLTRIPLLQYALASWIGMIPGTVMYVYLGTLAQVGINRRDRTPAEWAFYAAGLAAAIGVAVVITRIARRALDQKLG